MYDNTEKLIHVKIDTEVSAFRINCLNIKRVFSVYDEVVKRNSIKVLLNEYSQTLGKIVKDRLLEQTGLVEIEDIQFNYRIRTMAKGEVYVFLLEQSKEVFNCSINEDMFKTLNETQVSILMFSLCWYAYLSKKKEGMLSLALS
jgi:hypothetical protein